MTGDERPGRLVRPLSTLVLTTSGAHEREDCVAVEAPLQVIVNGRPFAVAMRTPGDDRHLAAGFLLAESVIASARDLLGIAEQTTPAGRDAVDVTLAPHVPWPRSGIAREVTMTAACGMCGRVSVESIEIDAPRLPIETWRLDAALLASLPARLHAVQEGFARSGGLHASALFTLDGTLVAHAEDVGRHNALDKVIGRALLAGLLPLSGHVLAVSGRTSFEIVQKAHLAGLPVIVAVSAPTTMAVALAEAAGITLTGFVRDGGVNVYAHAERVGGIGRRK